MTAINEQPPSGTARHPRRIENKAIRRGLISNVVAALLPALVAIFAVRILVERLGQSRFGVLSLAWAFIGAIGILDLGIGRALTRFLAARTESNETREATVVWTSLASLLVLGTLGGGLGWIASEPLAGLFVHHERSLLPETAQALRVMSISVPLVLLSSGLQGILLAFSRFDLSNRISIPLAVLNLLVPVLMLQFGATLPQLLGGLVLLRLAATIAFLIASLQILPSMRILRFSRSGMRSVFSFGGWVTVSNATGPLLSQFERFSLGTFVTLRAVAFFSTPADILNRVTIFPGAALQVLFPVLAQTIVHEPNRASRLVSRGQLFILGTTFPVFLLLTAVAPEALRLWLGVDFSDHASRAARLLAASVFVNCMAWLPFSVVQAAGRADLTGKLHLAEVPVHLALTVLFVRIAGVDGCALANLLRSATDAALVVWLAARVLPNAAGFARRFSALSFGGGLAIFGAALPIPLWARLVWSACSIALVALGAWRWYLDNYERYAARKAFGLVWPFGT
jgi:O-antigen/teichoic acid export membrane protein